jgi:glycosyltransferase involved in cell wall biosynthesis
VIGEALQYGIPVITSQLGGAPEKVIDGINGFIFNPYKEGDFAKVINKIQNNPDLIYQVKKGASETKIETIAEHVDKIEALYTKISQKLF